MNSDGCCKGNPQLGGSGCILKNVSGNVLWAAVDFYRETRNMQAEVKALFQGVKLCVENNVRCINVEVNSKILIQVLQKNIKPPWAIEYKIRQIGRLIEQLDVQLFHVYRKSNRATDWLANKDYREKKFMLFEGSSLPRSLRGMVILHKIGVWNLRVRKL